MVADALGGVAEANLGDLSVVLPKGKYAIFWIGAIVYPLNRGSRTKISLTRGRFTLLSLLTLTSCTSGEGYISCRVS